MLNPLNSVVDFVLEDFEAFIQPDQPYSVCQLKTPFPFPLSINPDALFSCQDNWFPNLMWINGTFSYQSVTNVRYFPYSESFAPTAWKATSDYIIFQPYEVSYDMISDDMLACIADPSILTKSKNRVKNLKFI